jgi:hypothetical protein
MNTNSDSPRNWSFLSIVSVISRKSHPI